MGQSDMTLTEKEYQVLHSIVISEYQPGGSPVNQPVYTDCLWDVKRDLIKSGVFSSLVKKGYIGVNRSENTCWITLSGMKAYNEYVKK